MEVIAHFEKLIVAQPQKKLPELCRTEMFITMFTKIATPGPNPDPDESRPRPHIIFL
jgi:hypothetical protein